MQWFSPPWLLSAFCICLDFIGLGVVHLSPVSRFSSADRGIYSLLPTLLVAYLEIIKNMKFTRKFEQENFSEVAAKRWPEKWWWESKRGYTYPLPSPFPPLLEFSHQIATCHACGIVTRDCYTTIAPPPSSNVLTAPASPVTSVTTISEGEMTPFFRSKPLFI